MHETNKKGMDGYLTKIKNGLAVQLNLQMNNSTLNNLTQQLREFATERDWDQFHSPKNLSMALSVEVSELLEHFQWLTEEQSRNLPKEKLDEVAAEIADVFIYLLHLSDKLDIKLLDAAQNKIKQNAIKYPASKVRGSSKKYAPKN